MNNKKPNILLITTDQQRYDTINCSGYDFIETPNLDKLAEEGCLYKNAYSPNPVCIPARHNLLTSLSAKFHTFDDNYFDDSRKLPHDLPTFPQILSDNGYDSTAIGKMHFQPCRQHNGFNRLFIMEEIPAYQEDDDYCLFLKEKGFGHIQSIHGVRHLLYMLPQQSLVPKELHSSSWVADKTVEVLETNGGKRPFLIWSSFIHPHPPFNVPKEYADMYKDKDIPEGYESITPISPLARENKHIADYPSKEYLRRARELYYASISFVDYNIGKIIDKLKEIGEYENTLIIFTSDHGEMLGDNGTFQKFLPYDASSKIPMIMRFPKNIKPGTVENKFVDLNDILPSMLDIAGVKYPAKFEIAGESVFHSNKKNRDYQYIEHCKGNKRWISLRNKKYKYNYYYGGGLEELFDLINDPKEQSNLLEDDFSESILKIKENLRKELVLYEKKWGLEGSVINDDFIKLPKYMPKTYRETNFPIFPHNLSENETNSMMSIVEEINLAIEKEPIVNLKELDVETFKKYGNIDDRDIKKLFKSPTITK